MSALNSSAIADDSSDEDSLIASLSVLPTPAPGPFNKGRVNSGGGSIGSFRLHQRRESNANLDAVHDLRASTEISPAQLYLTDSGHLFHAGKICIVLVGLPARGKTHHAVALTRYLRWLGVKTHAFHLGDYRRKLSGENFKVPDDYFQINASPATAAFRKKVIDSCLGDLIGYLKGGGQVAIYDAVNATVNGRRDLKAKFEAEKIGVLFVECISTDDYLVARNVRDVKLSSPDFQGVDYQDAVRSYLRRIELRIPHYETMEEKELSFIKLVNVSERFILNRAPLGYLQNRIVFFLMNTHLKSGSVYFARAGPSSTDSELQYKNDDPLNETGHDYAKKLRDTLLAHLEERNALLQSGRTTTNTTETPSTPLRRHQDDDDIHALIPEEQIQSRLAKAKETTPSKQRQWTTPTPTTSSVWSKGGLHESQEQLIVWTSKRVRTIETAQYFSAAGITVTQRSQLTQKNPGDVDGLTEAEIKQKFPEEYREHLENPYHHRYSRAESYHDVAVRMEPLIMEMERTRGDLLIIAHESVLRVLYGYLMACSVQDIPLLRFPRNEIVEIRPNAYYNLASRVKIEGVQPWSKKKKNQKNKSGLC